MARPPKFSSEEKLRIVLSVLRGECSIKETARRERVSETSIAKWRDLFVEGGAQALADGARRGPSEREVELERRLEQVTSALGEAHVELRLLRRGGAGAVPFRSWS
jgi:transposase